MSPFPPPAPDFSDPLGLLRACHLRIRQHCETLIRLAQRVTEGPIDRDACVTAATVHRYFSEAAPHHHADEELDLFPMLHRDPGLAPLLDSLAREHQTQARAWDLLGPALADLEGILDPLAFEHAAKAFARNHLLHLETEDRMLLPAAEQLLDASQIQALGAAMARRRQAQSDQRLLRRGV